MLEFTFAFAALCRFVVLALRLGLEPSVNGPPALGLTEELAMEPELASDAELNMVLVLAREELTMPLVLALVELAMAPVLGRTEEEVTGTELIVDLDTSAFGVDFQLT